MSVMEKNPNVVFALLLLFILAVPTLNAQDKYGLQFVSKGVEPEARTSLNLFPDAPMKVDQHFSLSFELTFQPDAPSYFGYIFRMVDELGQNTDLVYSVQTQSLHLVHGNSFAGSPVRLSPQALSACWHKVTLQVDGQQLSFSVDQLQQHHIDLPAHSGKQIRLFFGANNYQELKTADVAPMRLRNILLACNGHATYYWPLDQLEGHIVTDRIAGQQAQVQNPQWLKHHYSEWEPALAFNTTGNASVAFDRQTGRLYIVGQDSLFTYDYSSNRLQGTAFQHPRGLPAGNQSLFDSRKKQLYNFLADDKQMALYDEVHHDWSYGVHPDSVTHYWHSNKFYAAFDSAVYIIGGYGDYHYKNDVQRYATATQTWETVSVQGDRFTPRYLAALGTNDAGDSAYIIGGYGTLDGNQLLNPHHLYDMMLLDVKHHSFKRLYELPEPATPFVFVNSMLVRPAERAYYALTFANDQTTTSLQLIRGSLDTPAYTLLGGPIPFRFQDTRTRTELFYSAQSQRLIAVVLNSFEDIHFTGIKVYTILFPPSLPQPHIAPRWNPAHLYHFIALCTALLVVLLGCWLLYMQRNCKTGVLSWAETLAASALTQTAPPVEEAPAPVNEPPTPTLITIAPVSRASVHLFGNFAVYDREGNDISKLFSPLVKELFLLLLLYSSMGRRGISSEKINEILWTGRSVKDAKNNRSVNMVKLKNILDKMGDYSLVKENGKWLLELGPAIEIDLQQYHELMSNTGVLATPSTIEQLLPILDRGALLAETTYSWLDKFKSDIATAIIPVLTHFLEEKAAQLAPAFILTICNCILHFDSLSEEAVIFKCRAFISLGQHATARAIYSSFENEYRQVYGETFDKEYQSIKNDFIEQV